MPFFWFDPTFVLLLHACLLAAYAQLRLKATYRRYAEVRSSTGYTGAQLAAELLGRRGMANVTIEPIQGMLADNYDPRAKVLRLSPDVYQSDSLAAIGVAAHETGHALQDRDGYKPLALPAAIVPAATLGTNAAWILFIIRLFTHLTPPMDLGILFFLGYVVFSLVTLPVQ